MAIVPDLLSGNRTGFDEERIGFWSSLNGLWFNTASPVAYALLRDQDQQVMRQLLLLDTSTIMHPRVPELRGMFEAQLAR